MHKRTEWKHKRDQACKKQDNKPDREKKSSTMWVEVHEIEVIFTLNDVIVELCFVSVSKEATELLNSSQQGNNQDDYVCLFLSRRSGLFTYRLRNKLRTQTA